MAKKVISVNLDEKTIDEMDSLARKMGVSRSTFCEMTLSTAVGGQSVSSFTKWLFSGKQENEQEDGIGDLATA